jgi:DUF1680 family protein
MTMKNTLLLLFGIYSFLSCNKAEDKYADYPIQQIGLNQVELTDAFWLPKIQTVQKKTIQYAFDKCDTEGRFENFITAGKVIKGEKGKTRGKMPFDDTDVYKTIEGAAYSLVSSPDAELDRYLDSIISIVATGQEPDGYLTTWRTIDPMNPPAGWVRPGERWTDLGSSHELYNSDYDIIKRTLYNALIAGISLEGTEFFYPNPLESDGKYAFNMGTCTRQAWFDCSCCPTNLIRFIPYIPDLIYAKQDDSIYINLFMSNKVSIPLHGKNIEISQETDYPWSGNITVNVKPVKNQIFTLKLRIPGWVSNQVTPGSLYSYKNKPTESYRVLLNGETVESQMKNGYVEITREWKNDDRIELSLPMEVRQVIADEKVKDDTGLVAVEYGPLVYCMEESSNNNSFDFAPPTPQTTYSVEKQPDLLGGVNVIQETTADRQTTLIPYYAWSNKGVSKMKVWR